jgi:hypothetical protein
MVSYDDRVHGATASPIVFMMYLELVNRQDFGIKIDRYWVDVGWSRYLPWWHRLPPISLLEYPVYAIGIPGLPTDYVPAPHAVMLPKGTYRFEEVPGNKQAALRHSMIVKANPIFDAEIQSQIGPHTTIQGWSAFDRADDINDLAGYYIRISVEDSTGTISSSIVTLPLHEEGFVDTTDAITTTTNELKDRSALYLKFYSQP